MYMHLVDIGIWYGTTCLASSGMRYDLLVRGRLTDESEVLAEDLILSISFNLRHVSRRTLGCIPSPCSAALRTNNSWNFLGLSFAGGSLESFDELLVIDGPCNTDPVIVKRISGAGPAAAGASCQFRCTLALHRDNT